MGQRRKVCVYRAIYLLAYALPKPDYMTNLRSLIKMKYWPSERFVLDGMWLPKEKAVAERIACRAGRSFKDGLQMSRLRQLSS
jgi:hypothetical protein